MRIRKGTALAAALGLALALSAAPAANGQTGAAPRAGMAGDVSGLPSENTAVALGAVGALAGVFLPLVDSQGSGGGWALLTTWCAGPSLGFFYGGCWGRGLLTTGLRFGLCLAGALAALDSDNYGGIVYLWLGGMAATTMWDLVTTRRAVRKRNQRIAARQGLRLEVAPLVLRKGAGLKLQVSF